jgi:AraC-like DNA-binding protein
MAAFLLVGTLQAWFLVLLLASKRDKSLSDRVLTAWLALIGAHTLCLYLHQAHGPIPAGILQLNAAFPFLQGPFLFLYVVLLTSRRPRLRAGYLWHLIPFGAFVVFQLQLLSAPEGHVTRYRSLLSLQNGFSLWLLASVPIYILASAVVLRRYRKRLADTRSNVDRIHLRWLRVLVAGMGFVWLAVLLTMLFNLASDDPNTWRAAHLVFPALTLFVYAIGYFGFRQTSVFAGSFPSSASETPARAERAAGESPLAEEDAGVTAPRKYQKSGLAADEGRHLRVELLKFMKDEQPYLDPEVTLADLALSLGAQTNHVSQVINELEGQSFYDFVNRYRVEAAAARLRDPEWTQATVLDIAFDSGFGSKSTFNRIFRARIGQTPNQYRHSAKAETPGPSG